MSSAKCFEISVSRICIHLLLYQGLEAAAAAAAHTAMTPDYNPMLRRSITISAIEQSTDARHAGRSL